jgi:hypothetical protein
VGSPPAAQRFDQTHAGGITLAAQLRLPQLFLEKNSLGLCHRQIGAGARAVTRFGEFHLASRGFGRPVHRGRLFFAGLNLRQ